MVFSFSLSSVRIGLMSLLNERCRNAFLPFAVIKTSLWYVHKQPPKERRTDNVPLVRVVLFSTDVGKGIFDRGCACLVFPLK